MRRRKLEEWIFKIMTCLATCSIAGILIFILIFVVFMGIHALTIEIVTTSPKGGYYYGGEGGILNAIIGSLYLAVGATLLAIFISIPAALFIHVNLIRYKRVQNIIRYLLDALWGVPSIVYGAFGFTLMIFLGLKASLLAGIITVSVLITPILIRAFDEFCKNIPVGLHEASMALGSTNSETSFKVILKQGISGLVTAILLAFGRGIGDAASVIFTAGYTDLIPSKLTDPAATLPLAIFFQLNSPIPEVRDRAFASAIVLTTIILFISLTGRILGIKYSKTSLK